MPFMLCCPPCRDQWLEYAAKAFSTLDADTNGRISAADLMRMLGSKLPEHEVEYAVEDALVDAGYAGRLHTALKCLRGKRKSDAAGVFA